jgi:transcriptional regulator NrdR family protein
MNGNATSNNKAKRHLRRRRACLSCEFIFRSIDSLLQQRCAAVGSLVN